MSGRPHVNEQRYGYTSTLATTCSVLDAHNAAADTNEIASGWPPPLAAAQALLAAAHDSWDPMREAASSVLQALPRPLPGLTTPAELQQLLDSVAARMCSARLHDAEAAARVLSLVDQVYVAQLGWSVQRAGGAPLQRTQPPCTDADAHSALDIRLRAAPPQQPSATPSGHSGSQRASASLERRLQLLEALAGHSDAVLAAAAEDCVAACRRGFLQGPLLATRRLCEGVPWYVVAQDAALVRPCTAWCVSCWMYVSLWVVHWQAKQSAQFAAVRGKQCARGACQVSLAMVCLDADGELHNATCLCRPGRRQRSLRSCYRPHTRRQQCARRTWMARSTSMPWRWRPRRPRASTLTMPRLPPRPQS